MSNSPIEKTNERDYGHPRPLEEKEYKEYISYIHFTKETTQKIREHLSNISDEWENEAMFGIFKDGRFVIEVPDKNCELVNQMICKVSDNDFIIFHTKEKQVFIYNIDMFLIRIGGARRKETNLQSFKKDEFRIFIEDNDSEPLIG